MLDKEVFKEEFNKLLAIFPMWKVNHLDSYTMKTWYHFFKNLENGEFSNMVNEYCRRERANPTVKGLWDYYGLRRVKMC